MNYFQYAGITKREHLGMLLDRANLHGKAVEVGTHRGVFAYAFLNCWHGGELYCVDHWESGYHPDDPAALGNREEDLEETRRVLKRFSDEGRVHIIRQPSQIAVKEFEDESLDLVYIDSDHRDVEVLHEMERWWPKIRPGGMMAGHDYICPGEKEGGWGKGIQLSVDWFSKKHDLVIYLITDTGPWSFCFKKEGS